MDMLALGVRNTLFIVHTPFCIQNEFDPNRN
jgi:hypothetical protein